MHLLFGGQKVCLESEECALWNSGWWRVWWLRQLERPPFEKVLTIETNRDDHCPRTAKRPNVDAPGRGHWRCSQPGLGPHGPQVALTHARFAAETSGYPVRMTTIEHSSALSSYRSSKLSNSQGGGGGDARLPREQGRGSRLVYSFLGRLCPRRLLLEPRTANISVGSIRFSEKRILALSPTTSHLVRESSQPHDRIQELVT